MASEIDPRFQTPSLDTAVRDLRRDLLSDGGPRISTMRNYRFAILCYDPGKEFEMRARIRQLSDEAEGRGWEVLSLSLRGLLMDRLKSEAPGVLESIIGRERRLHAKSPDRGLRYLKDRLTGYIEEPGGLASAVIGEIDKHADAHPDRVDQTLIFLGGAGALYPFFRWSPLLRFIDGKTRAIPVVLLYPGRRQGETGLSFMGELKADRDYRPRIYS